MTEEEMNETTPTDSSASRPDPSGEGADVEAGKAEVVEETPAPVEEPAAEEAPAGPPEEEAVVLHPKQKRKLERSTHAGEALPERGVEERIAERAAARARNAAEHRRRRAAVKAKKGEPGEGTPPAERVAGSKKVQQGTVVSDKADKTITVRVDIVRRHRRYEKVVRHSSTVHAHDERNEAKAGDVVRVIEARPLSKLKRWRLVEVVERAR